MASDKKKPPRVRARERGQIATVLAMPVDELRKKNPDKEYRYVYAPEDGKDFGQVAKRRLMGYEPVSAEESGVEGHGVVGDRVRAGDVMLMEIDKELHEEEVQARRIAALEEANRPQETYERSIDTLAANSGAGQFLKSRGKVSRTHEDYKLNIPEREEE